MHVVRKAFEMLVFIIVSLSITSCWSCQDELVSEIPSPTGEYKAVVRKCGCDVSTGLYVSVDVADIDKEIACKVSGLAGINMHANQELSMEWNSDSVLIVSFPGTEVGRSPTGSYRRKDSPVSIVFK